MGEAKLKAEVKANTHDIVMTWVARGILIHLVRLGEGKGLAHGRMVKRTVGALKADDDFDYLMDANANLLTPPGEQRLAMPPVPGIVKELVAAGFIDDASGIASVAIVTRAELECPDRVVTLTTEQIEFLLKAAEEKPLRNVLQEEVVDALGDMEDAKAGRYEVPSLLARQPAEAAS